MFGGGAQQNRGTHVLRVVLLYGRGGFVCEDLYGRRVRGKASRGGRRAKGAAFFTMGPKGHGAGVIVIAVRVRVRAPHHSASGRGTLERPKQVA